MIIHSSRSTFDTRLSCAPFERVNRGWDRYGAANGRRRERPHDGTVAGVASAARLSDRPEGGLASSASPGSSWATRTAAPGRHLRHRVSRTHRLRRAGRGLRHGPRARPAHRSILEDADCAIRIALSGSAAVCIRVIGAPEGEGRIGGTRKSSAVGVLRVELHGLPALPPVGWRHTQHGSGSAGRETPL